MHHRWVDRVSLGLARRGTRRGAMRAAGASGLAAVAGGGLVRPARAQVSQSVCVLEFTLTVRVGPDSESAADAEILGELRIPFGEGGSFDDGSLETDDGVFEVVGQGSGRSVSFRIDLGGRETIVAVGAGDSSLRACRGEYGGPATGPARGDLGDWRAIALELVGADDAESTVAPSDGGGGGSSDTPDPTPTLCVPQACTDPLAWDPAACECNCSWIGQVACGPVCCPIGSVCNDPGSGNCSCPGGTELCIDTCVELCPAGKARNWGDCTCA